MKYKTKTFVSGQIVLNKLVFILNLSLAQRKTTVSNTLYRKFSFTFLYRINYPNSLAYDYFYECRYLFFTAYFSFTIKIAQR